MKNRLALNSFLLFVLLTNCVPALQTNLFFAAGEVVSESRSVSNFHAVTLAGPGNLVITQGATEALTVVAAAKRLPAIKSVVQDGVLTLMFDSANWRTTPSSAPSIQFILMLKKLDALTLTGQGHIDIAALKTAGLHLTLAGPGDIRIARLATSDFRCSVTKQGNLHIPSLKATHAGCIIAEAGNIELAGQLTQQEITITDQGNYQAGDLDSQVAKVGINGVGKITLWVRKRLDIDVFGTGTVAYYGNPTVFQCGLGAVDLQSLGNK